AQPAAAQPAAARPAAAQPAAAQDVWRFDRTDSLGGHPAKALGSPAVIETSLGRAVQFNGKDSALLLDVHPLAGARQWTWEIIFRPDPDGAAAQRIFHLQARNPHTGADLPDRMLFEIRIVGNAWCLDSFAASAGQSATLLHCEKLHPFGPFYRVTAVYDGATLKNYVGDELQGEASVHLAPQSPGHASAGVRINRVDWFKGAIFEARFTRRALSPPDFLKLSPRATVDSSR
ncbi:MAG: LamG domain-containing protein, partial [Acidobacteriota bacterium]|nr:LamG domain-containing protein [Acidobacteriota bacterium]